MTSRIRLAGALAAALWTAPLLGAAAAAPVATAAPGARGDAPSGADIRDIHGPIWIPGWWRPWMLAMALLPVAGAAMGIGLANARRRRRPLSPSERALARLDEAAPFAAKGQSRAYAEAASDAIRTYLEESFGLPVTHRTTDEFFEELLEQPLPALQPHILAFEHFLGACDLAKFSLYGVAREDLGSLNELARKLVLATVQPKSPPKSLVRSSATPQPAFARTA